MSKIKAPENRKTTTARGSKTQKSARGGGARQLPAAKTKGNKISKKQKDNPKGKEGERAKLGSKSLLAMWNQYREGIQTQSSQLLTDTDSQVAEIIVPEEGVERGSQEG